LTEPRSLDRIYRGDGKRQEPFLEDILSPEVEDIKNFLINDIVRTPEPYIPNDELINAVNVALHLRRPLLLEGEPGCGKTRLAYAVAYELGFPLKACYIRSTSRAQDLLYTFDAVRRLYDMQEYSTGQNRAEVLAKEKYITFGKLGEAIRLAEKDIPSVVLIDEIDKADIDFPNDLLLVLDRFQFEVSEVEGLKFDALKEARESRRNSLPLIIITSNREKELPKPFLRRCLFCYIKFPDKNSLRAIVKSHLGNGNAVPVSLHDEAITKFVELRDPNNEISWRKIPGTSELLDWVSVLERDARAGKITSEHLAEAPINRLPYPETLVKTQSDSEALSHIRHISERDA
jgi:MoxR-like ATPase